MFFNIGGAEILVIAVIALIAVGPEQLPSVLRKVGRTTAQIRSMAAGLRDEFMSGLDEATEVAKPETWFGGSGGAEDPVVRRGYAASVEGAASDDGSDAAGDPLDGDGAAIGESAGDVVDTDVEVVAPTAPPDDEEWVAPSSTGGQGIDDEEDRS